MAIALLSIGVFVLLAIDVGDGDPPAAGSMVARPAAARPAEQVAVAAAIWMDRTASPSDLASRGRRADLVDDLAAPTAKARIGSQLDETAQAFSGEGSAGVVLRAVPLGYRIRSVTARRAVVETRQVVLQAAPGTMTAGQLAVGRIELVHDDGWRVADASVSASPLDAVSREGLEQLDAFRGFRHVP